MPSARLGRAILPAAAFQAALSRRSEVFGLGKRRLKALPRGHPSQDWPPHNLCRTATGSKVSDIGLSGYAVEMSVPVR